MHICDFGKAKVGAPTVLGASRKCPGPRTVPVRSMSAR